MTHPVSEISGSATGRAVRSRRCTLIRVDAHATVAQLTCLVAFSCSPHKPIIASLSRRPARVSSRTPRSSRPPHLISVGRISIEICRSSSSSMTPAPQPSPCPHSLSLQSHVSIPPARGEGVRRILVRWVSASLPPEAKKIWLRIGAFCSISEQICGQRSAVLYICLPRLIS